MDIDGCPFKISLSKDEPQRAPGYKVCKCNKIMDEMEPGICTVICPVSVLDDNCVCKKTGYGGLACDEKLCRMHGTIYCIKKYGTPSTCIGGNTGGGDNHPICPCSNGNLINDRCVCNQDYGGTFCENYNPPYRPQNYYTTAKPKSGSNLNIALPVGIIVGVVVIAIIAALVCKKRRSYASGFAPQTPIPGSTVPGASVPMYPPAPANSGPVPYPSAPMPYQPATANQAAITTTYTFQPPGSTSASNVYSTSPTAPNFGQDGAGQPLQPYQSEPPPYQEAVRP